MKRGRLLSDRGWNAVVTVLFAAGFILLALVLAGCATVVPEPKVVTKEVLVPVSRACVPSSLPPAPAYADDGMVTNDPVERTLRRGGANQQRKARLAILEPIIAACR